MNRSEAICNMVKMTIWEEKKSIEAVTSCDCVIWLNDRICRTVLIILMGGLTEQEYNQFNEAYRGHLPKYETDYRRIDFYMKFRSCNMNMTKFYDLIKKIVK